MKQMKRKRPKCTESEKEQNTKRKSDIIETRRKNKNYSIFFFAFAKYNLICYFAADKKSGPLSFKEAIYWV